MSPKKAETIRGWERSVGWTAEKTTNIRDSRMQPDTNLLRSKMENGMRIFKSKRLISLTENKHQNKTASKCILSLPLNQSVKFTYSQAPVRQSSRADLLRRYAAFLHTHCCVGKALEREFQHNDDSQRKNKAPKQNPTIKHPSLVLL